MFCKNFVCFLPTTPSPNPGDGLRPSRIFHSPPPAALPFPSFPVSPRPSKHPFSSIPHVHLSSHTLPAPTSERASGAGERAGEAFGQGKRKDLKFRVAFQIVRIPTIYKTTQRTWHFTLRREVITASATLIKRRDMWQALRGTCDRTLCQIGTWC